MSCSLSLGWRARATTRLLVGWYRHRFNYPVNADPATPHQHVVASLFATCWHNAAGPVTSALNRVSVWRSKKGMSFAESGWFGSGIGSRRCGLFSVFLWQPSVKHRKSHGSVFGLLESTEYLLGRFRVVYTCVPLVAFKAIQASQCQVQTIRSSWL